MVARLESYERIMRLKCLARTGWMQRGVPPALAETVASHSFEAAMLAYLIALEIGSGKINAYRAAFAALLHDAAEALVGDIPLWSSRRLGGLKDGLEEEAARELGLNDIAGMLGEEGIRHIVRAADLLATALQARRYMKMGYIETREIYQTSRNALCRIIEEELRDAQRLVESLLEEPCR